MSKSNGNGTLAYEIVSKEVQNDLSFETERLTANADKIDAGISVNLGNNNEECRFSGRRDGSEDSGRIVTKRGIFTTIHKNISESHWSFFTDLFTTLVDVRWRVVLLIFCCTYFGSWLLFAGIWYGVLYFHGDFEPAHMEDSKWRACIKDLKDFTGAFLFSVETQHTTGYGFYHLTEECTSAIMTFCMQSIVGCILEGLMVGLVFVKLTRGKKRTATIMFSRKAVICRRDGYLCLMFRVADMRNKSNLLQARIRAQLISSRVTEEGEVLSMSPQELEVHGDGERKNELLLFWPTTIIHRITPTSPLYKLSAADLANDATDFEIIVVLEGIVEATGQMTQARSSYLPSEILWGHRLHSLTSEPRATNVKSKADELVIDYSNFHETVPVLTSGLSAYQLMESAIME